MIGLLKAIVNVGVVGAGVSGCYLACLLHRNGHKVELFESCTKNNRWSICAWAAPRKGMTYFSRKAGLNFEDYILHQGNKIKMVHLGNEILYNDFDEVVTFDKNKWESDLLNSVNIKYGMRCQRENFPYDRYDYVIDCTGVHRSLLPRVKEDLLIPCYEFLVEEVFDMEYFYISNYTNGNGYFWYFPIGRGRGYVGAGDFLRQYGGLAEFFKLHPSAKIVKKIGRPLRLAPPTIMRPFNYGNVIGVGESIGCVFPLTGEGIVPSLICCEIFMDIFNRTKPRRFDFEFYEQSVLIAFGFYNDAYRILKLVLEGKINRFIDHLGDLKGLVVNSSARAREIHRAADILEILALINLNACLLNYPITSHHDLAKRLSRNTKANLVQTIKDSIPESYFPILDYKDLDESLFMIAEYFNDILTIPN